MGSSMFSICSVGYLSVSAYGLEYIQHMLGRVFISVVMSSAQFNQYLFAEPIAPKPKSPPRKEVSNGGDRSENSYLQNTVEMK